MYEFFEEWGGIIKTVLTFITFLGILWAFLKKINTMSENVAIIPELKESVENTATEFKTFKEDHETYEKMIENVKDNLEKHCANDNKKQKMALDMARQVLLNELEKSIKEKEVTVSRKAVIGELYDSYEACGGNGAVHDLW